MICTYSIFLDLFSLSLAAASYTGYTALIDQKCLSLLIAIQKLFQLNRKNALAMVKTVLHSLHTIFIWFLFLAGSFFVLALGMFLAALFTGTISQSNAYVRLFTALFSIPLMFVVTNPFMYKFFVYPLILVVLALSWLVVYVLHWALIIINKPAGRFSGAVGFILAIFTFILSPFVC